MSILFQIFTVLATSIAALILILLILSISRGAAPIPTNLKTVRHILELTQGKPGEKAIDLGSGDGRIVIALAKHGLHAYGYEINPLLVWGSNYRIRKEGLQQNAFIEWKSFWNKQAELLKAFQIQTLTR